MGNMRHGNQVSSAVCVCVRACVRACMRYVPVGMLSLYLGDGFTGFNYSFRAPMDFCLSTSLTTRNFPHRLLTDMTVTTGLSETT